MGDKLEAILLIMLTVQLLLTIYFNILQKLITTLVIFLIGDIILCMLPLQ